MCQKVVHIKSTFTNLSFQIFTALKETYSEIDKNLLPKEYGGEIPQAEMISELFLFYNLFFIYRTLNLTFRIMEEGAEANKGKTAAQWPVESKP